MLNAALWSPAGEHCLVLAVLRAGVDTQPTSPLRHPAAAVRLDPRLKSWACAAVLVSVVSGGSWPPTRGLRSRSSIVGCLPTVRCVRTGYRCGVCAPGPEKPNTGARAALAVEARTAERGCSSCDPAPTKPPEPLYVCYTRRLC